jgi:hypothetical protein
MSIRTLFSRIRKRIAGQEVTLYPSYGYRDPGDETSWLVPMRVWVHDNRDTPFVERVVQDWAAGHFGKDLKRPLEPAEKAQLRECLQNFIADDKNNESVEIRFEDDPAGTVFRLKQRTSPSGVIEEALRIPDALVQACYARQADGDRWLAVHARTGDGNGEGVGAIRFLEPEGLCVISDIDDTIKVTRVPAGKKTVLRNTFLRKFEPAPGMLARYKAIEASEGPGADVCFHYVSGSPWQMYSALSRFLFEETGFPPGTLHMKALRLNLVERGSIGNLVSFAVGGDLATLDQKVRQITDLLLHLPRRKFILVGDSGERDPEVYRAIRELFPGQVREIRIRDVLGQRLDGMQVISEPDAFVALDTSDLVAEMKLLVDKARSAGPASPKL